MYRWRITMSRALASMVGMHLSDTACRHPNGVNTWAQWESSRSGDVVPSYSGADKHTQHSSFLKESKLGISQRLLGSSSLAICTPVSTVDMSLGAWPQLAVTAEFNLVWSPCWLPLDLVVVAAYIFLWSWQCYQSWSTGVINVTKRPFWSSAKVANNLVALLVAWFAFMRTKPLLGVCNSPLITLLGNNKVKPCLDRIIEHLVCWGGSILMRCSVVHEQPSSESELEVSSLNLFEAVLHCVNCSFCQVIWYWMESSSEMLGSIFLNKFLQGLTSKGGSIVCHNTPWQYKLCKKFKQVFHRLLRSGI